MRSPVRKARGIALLSGAGIAAAVGTAAAGIFAYRKITDAIGLDLRGKVVLVTGSSRGLGFALAQEVARFGARIVLCARDPEELRWAREELARGGTDVFAVECDVANKEQVDRLIEQATARFGRIDVLINNAGIITSGPLESQTLDDFVECMDVMFWGTVYPTLAVLPHMLARRSGRIANITSIGGKVPVPHLLPYCCAKFAAVGFSEGLRAELHKDGITVTTVVPGLMRTGSHVNAYFKGDHRAEYSLFSLMATSPLTAVAARKAARRIVRAIRLGRAEIILTPQAHLAELLHGLFPGQFTNVMALSNRLLPRSASKERFTGKQSETAVTRSPLTALGRLAGEKLHQYPERHGVNSHGPAGIGTQPIEQAS